MKERVHNIPTHYLQQVLHIKCDSQYHERMMTKICLELIREYLKETTKMRDRPGEKEEEEKFEGAKERKRFAF